MFFTSLRQGRVPTVFPLRFFSSSSLFKASTPQLLSSSTATAEADAPVALLTPYQSSSPYYTTPAPRSSSRDGILKKFPHLHDYIGPSLNITKQKAEERNAILAAQFKADHNFPPKLSGWDFYRSIGSPKYVVAPMVDQSELAWRILSRRYGADLCYTPMFNAKLFVENERYRDEQWPGIRDGLGGGGPNDRPLIVQVD
jgi:hypothetical protein